MAATPTKLTFFPHLNSSSSSSSTSAASSASSSFPSDDLELLTMKPNSQSYTSLRDLIPSVAMSSPKSSNQSQLGSDICIRNRLVKQAAWAYLQPMSTSPVYSGGSFFHRLWPQVTAFIDFVRRNLIGALNWMLRIIQMTSPI